MNSRIMLDTSNLPEDFRNALLKAAETNATYTWDPAARSVFTPFNIADQVNVLAPTETPLRNRIPRIKGFGQATTWKRLTSKLNSKVSAVAGNGTLTSIAFADAGAPGATSQTYDTVSASYKLLGRSIEVGGLANAASQGGIDMLAHRQGIKAFEVMLGEEELLIKGDSAYDTNEFDGLLKQITTNSGIGGMTSLTASGLAPAFQALSDTWGANPNVLAATGVQIIKLSNDLAASGSIQRIVQGDQSGMVGGMHLSQLVNPATGMLVDVVQDRYLDTNALLLTTKSPAGEAYIEIEELIPMSVVDVPSSNFSYIRFVLEALVLKVLYEPYQYKFSALATS